MSHVMIRLQEARKKAVRMAELLPLERHVERSSKKNDQLIVTNGSDRGDNNSVTLGTVG